LPTSDRRVFVETAKLSNPRHVESQRSSHDAIVVAIEVLKNPGDSRSRKNKLDYFEVQKFLSKRSVSN